jgi:hypothetical protein
MRPKGRGTELQGEIIMNPQDENQDTVQTSAHNPFPEPQTIPSGWDMSAFLSVPQLVSNEQVEVLVENEDN